MLRLLCLQGSDERRNPVVLAWTFRSTRIKFSELGWDREGLALFQTRLAASLRCVLTFLMAGDVVSVGDSQRGTVVFPVQVSLVHGPVLRGGRMQHSELHSTVAGSSVYFGGHRDATDHNLL